MTITIETYITFNIQLTDWQFRLVRGVHPMWLIALGRSRRQLAKRSQSLCELSVSIYYTKHIPRSSFSLKQKFEGKWM